MNAKIIAVIAVVVVVAAGVGAAVVLMNKSDEYYSKNTEGRLGILGNADENDYLDGKDIDKINDMIKNSEYSQMADANNDTFVDSKDVEYVQKIIDLKKSNSGKAAADKEKMDVWYITAENKIQTAKFPVSKVICCNTQRGLDIAVNIGAKSNIVAINQYIIDYATSKDSTYMYKDFKDLPSIGDRGNPNLETIASMKDADAIWAGTSKTYLKNVDANAVEYSGKTILRFATWENGDFPRGALMLGFFTDNDASAQKFVKWMDEVEKDIKDRLDKVENKSSVKFLNRNGNNYFGAQSDGVATAIGKTGATNVGNLIITDPTKAGGYIEANKEAIIANNPGIIFTTPYMYLSWSTDDVKDKYDSYTYTNIAVCDAVKNNNIYLINYELPFVLIKMLAAKYMFPDQFSDMDVDKYLKEFLNTYCDLDGTGYEYNANQFYYKKA